MTYYYTDPLAVEWMKDKYEMKFIPHKSEKTSFIYKWEIHPDSLHLLEPQTGDAVGYIDTIQFNIVSFDRKHYFKEIMDRGEPLAIIQRGGVPFMWPEQ